MYIRSEDSTHDSTSKKLKSTVFPSGLVANWKQKATARQPAKAVIPASASVEQTIGGLDDQDADAVQPDFVELSGKSRNKDRKNEVRYF